MATTRSLSTVTLDSPTARPDSGGPRHRLRAVAPDEVADVVDLLPPGTTWLPAPAHTLPALPGHPPMVATSSSSPPTSSRRSGTRTGPRTPAATGRRTRSSGSTPPGAPPPWTDANST